MAFFITSSCSTLFTYPDELTQEQRFQQIRAKTAPLKETVKIYWDQHSIPFIDAKNDNDLAFAVGMVHAHLRIDQLEIFRYLSQGRLSELAGPIPQVKQIDHGLRILDLKGSAQRSIKKMSPESLNWMKQFTAGVDWYVRQLKETTTTSSFIDEDLKEFSLVDILTITRLVTADLSWGTYLRYLKYAENKNWEDVFRFNLESLKTDSVTFDNSKNHKVSQVLNSFSKSGSNSLVISGKKTKSGSAMIASDPHVGIILPNFWILVGLHSPNYHAFGLMIPGVPIIGVGRNKDIAWGGTNMRSISSHLYNVSDLPKEQITIREEKIKRRWWFNTSVEVRETPYGPILSDLEFFDQEKLPFDAALDWVGREGTDEIHAFLKVAKAKNWSDFKNAFKSYKVSAQNMLYADRSGNIGMVAAYGQPILKQPKKTLDLIKNINNPIVRVGSPLDHPSPYNPKEGFIASANNKPFKSPKIPFSFTFANSDRVDRLKNWSQQKTIDLETLKKLQQDVFNQKAFQIKELLVLYAKEDKELLKDPTFKKVKNWDGHYKAESQGAVAFYVLMNQLWQDYLKEYTDKPLLLEDLQSTDKWKTLMIPWMEKQKPNDLMTKVKNHLKPTQGILEDYPTWGDLTVQTQSTLFGMVPLIGSRFKRESYPASGSPDTLNKYGRSFSSAKAEIFYGASARHISDLSSLDENYFVLHGGQDAWVMNENLNDQTQLWRKGEYIKVPLTFDKVKAQFNRSITTLTPKSAQ
ncbi:MAG: penicillin acylase family protein [Bdellovibrionales bacterium]|nr:penicillin acylase family protein [Bdellovibrionales bacterium]